jgi:hypothetical protein
MRDPEITLAEVASRLRLSELTLRHFLRRIGFTAIQGGDTLLFNEGSLQMPLALVPPGRGKSQNYRIRGTRYMLARASAFLNAVHAEAYPADWSRHGRFRRPDPKSANGRRREA